MLNNNFWSNQKKIKIVLTLLVAILIFLVAEIFFIVNEKGPRLRNLLTNSAQVSASISLGKKPMYFISHAAEIKSHEVSGKYPDRNLANFKIPKDADNSDLYKNMNAYLKSVDYSRLRSSSPNIWAKVFYDLALIAYEHNENGLTEELLLDSVALSPEWSPFHLELSNYYLEKGESEKSDKIIEYCVTFEYPEKACAEYKQELLSGSKPKKFGYYKNEIRQIKF